MSDELAASDLDRACRAHGVSVGGWESRPGVYAFLIERGEAFLEGEVELEPGGSLPGESVRSLGLEVLRQLVGAELGPGCWGNPEALVLGLGKVLGDAAEAVFSAASEGNPPPENPGEG